MLRRFFEQSVGFWNDDGIALEPDIIKYFYEVSLVGIIIDYACGLLSSGTAR